MKEYDAKVRLNEEDGGKTGELDIMSKPPFDKGYFKGVTYGIEFKEPVFEAERLQRGVNQMESNVERNRKIAEEFKKIPDGNGWLEGMFSLSARNTMLLIDISKSLARIADALERGDLNEKSTKGDH